MDNYQAEENATTVRDLSISVRVTGKASLRGDFEERTEAGKGGQQRFFGERIPVPGNS